jgi:hypothetical protein
MREAPITRDEFGMLRDQVRDNAGRLDAIDSTGTRGVAVIAAQVTDVIKDVAELRNELGKHEDKHVAEEKARVAGRRWALGFACAGLASMAAVIGLLLDIAATVHK